MTDSERIIELKKFTGLSFSKLAEELGLKTVQTLYDIKNGKHGISKDVAEKIQAKYLNVNLPWLLTGEGEMLKRDVSNSDFLPVANECSRQIPLLPVLAHGGSLNDFVASVESYDCEKVVSPINDVDFAIQISGDSMAPEYPAGSRIFIKKINECAFIEWGKAYVLDTCNGTVVKLLVPSDKEGYVRCVSINPDPIYAPFEVCLKDVYGIYRVMLCLAIK